MYKEKIGFIEKFRRKCLYVNMYYEPNSYTRYPLGAWAGGNFLRGKLQQEEKLGSLRNFVENNLMFTLRTMH
jgi:hypothetical protein